MSQLYRSVSSVVVAVQWFQKLQERGSYPPYGYKIDWNLITGWNLHSSYGDLRLEDGDWIIRMAGTDHVTVMHHNLFLAHYHKDEEVR